MLIDSSVAFPSCSALKGRTQSAEDQQAPPAEAGTDPPPKILQCGRVGVGYHSRVFAFLDWRVHCSLISADLLSDADMIDDEVVGLRRE